MEKKYVETLDGSIQLVKRLPLQWVQCEKNDLDKELDDLQLANEQTLISLAMLEDGTQDVQDYTESDTVAIRVLDRKINLLTQLIQYYLELNVDLPEKKQVHLTASGIRWEELEKPDLNAGDFVKVDLFLSRLFPKPLELACCVNKIQRDDRGYQLSCEFYCFSQPVVLLFEKMLFRHHRRAVANRITTN